MHRATRIQFLADQLGSDGQKLRSYFSCLYRGGELPALPWGDALFDCVLIAMDRESAYRLALDFADVIVRHAVDYVQTTGAHAEWIHDCVDEASVVHGVQVAVGDGRPMTTWHDDAHSLDAMCEVAETCFGSAEQVLCLVVGAERDEESFRERLRDRFGRRS